MNKGVKSCIYGQFFKDEYIRCAGAVRDWKTNMFIFQAQPVNWDFQ